jgi:hypothetical protein
MGVEVPLSARMSSAERSQVAAVLVLSHLTQGDHFWGSAKSISAFELEHIRVSTER